MYFSELVRRHKVSLCIFIFGPIIFTFILAFGNFDAISVFKGDNRRIAAPVIQVGEQAILGSDIERSINAALNQRRQQGQAEATRAELMADGTAGQILTDHINRALVDREAAQSTLQFSREYLQERFKNDPTFQDAEGKFDSAAFNNWVNDPAVNWNAVYESLADQTRRQLVGKRLVASARVFDSEVDARYAEDNTQLNVKFIEVEPPIEPTEEQLTAEYEANKDKYSLPEERIANFVAISVEADKPAKVDEVLTKATAGDDFEALAKQYSDSPSAADDGGLLPWRTEQAIGQPAHMEAMFALSKGEVSDAVKLYLNYFIYKMEDERTTATGQREVLVRQIVVNTPPLDEAERTARTELAESLAAAATESGDLIAAALAADLTVQTTSAFNTDSLTIENVPTEDRFSFRTGFADLSEGTVSDVITATNNLYVAQLKELIPTKEQPLDAVREEVTTDAIAALQRAPEHQAARQALAAEMLTKGESLDAIVGAYPELAIEVGTSGPFSSKDPGFNRGVPWWRAQDVYAAVGGQEPGAFGGPISGFLGNVYFVELVSATAPEVDSADEAVATELEALRTRLLGERQAKRMQDYLQFLRDDPNTPILIDQEAQDALFQINIDPAVDLPGDTASATE
jgi:parvulin-like peptidyl-prolyl isomerase